MDDSKKTITKVSGQLAADLAASLIAPWWTPSTKGNRSTR